MSAASAGAGPQYAPTFIVFSSPRHTEQSASTGVWKYGWTLEGCGLEETLTFFSRRVQELQINTSVIEMFSILILEV